MAAAKKAAVKNNIERDISRRVALYEREAKAAQHARPKDEKARNFSTLGEPITSADTPSEIREYWFVRGGTLKQAKKANLRWIDGRTVERIWPSTQEGTHDEHHDVCLLDKKTKSCFWPKYALILPDTDDSSYATARIFFEISELAKGQDVPNKFRTPAGRPLKVYRPASVALHDLLDPRKPFYSVESPIKAAIAAARGLTCVGVNGCSGWKEKEIQLPKNATQEQARATIRESLRPFLLPARAVCLLTDADIESNLGVRKAQLDFMDAAAIGFDCKPFLVQLPDLGDGKSGIDDYLAAGHSLQDFYSLPVHDRDSKIVKTLRNAYLDRNEFGLAKRFAGTFAGDCRADPRTDEWFTWTSSGYRNDRVEAQRRMVDVIECLKIECEAEKDIHLKKVRATFANSSGRLTTRDHALTLASQVPECEIDSTLFDADCNLLGVSNGILDLRTGRLREPSRELLVTRSAGCAFDPAAKAPLFAGFLETALDGDKEMSRHVQEVSGAALLGRAIRSAIHVFYGPSGTGKTTLTEIELAMLGDYAMASKADLLLRQYRNKDPEKASPFLKSLRGKRLVVCSELDEGVAFDDALIKDLTGGDTITARGLNEAPITFQNTAPRRPPQLPSPVAGAKSLTWQWRDEG